MRIAIVLNTSWNIFNFRHGLVKTLLEEGHQVVAIAPEDKYSENLVEMGCEFYAVKMQNKGTNPFKDLQYAYQLYKIYKNAKVDIILQFTIKPNIYGTFAALPLRKLVVNNVSGLGTVFLHNNLSSKIAKFLYKLSFKFPKKVFFQNEEDLQLFVEKNLIKEKTTDILPGSGVCLDKFQAQNFERNKTFNFLMIARLLYDKGIVEYVEAAKKLKNLGLKVNFQVLGSIESEAKLGVSKEEVEIWQEKNWIEYLGTSDNVSEIIKKADCVVLPSYREGTPRSLLEACAMAKPIITTDVVGCRQTVDDGVNGFLCEVKNAEDLADKMQKMYVLDNETLQKMGEASRTKVEKEFDEKIVINKYLNIIKSYEILQNRKLRKINKVKIHRAGMWWLGM
ncbi:MAG: glycosyltransferase family 1 protein [Bacteroidetes bacterium]|nr:MAG: glycosyltransferase family 1 protein [Bacteroidota bacterium]TAG95171.1 MAG: glycosyltransferase family 1 protein [Bacteroidota bacterium]